MQDRLSCLFRKNVSVLGKNHHNGKIAMMPPSALISHPAGKMGKEEGKMEMLALAFHFLQSTGSKKESTNQINAVFSGNPNI